MDFIETLKSVGAKPCPSITCVSGRQPGEVFSKETGEKVSDGRVCRICHGTGQIIDLAPLLAKPKELSECGRVLCNKLYNKHADNKECLCFEDWKASLNLYVVGPQRASNLVYECARQLGGTAALVQRGYWECSNAWDEPFYANPSSKSLWNPGSRLLYLIPPDATVLFVTDRLDDEKKYRLTNSIGGPSNHPYNEMQEIIHTVAGTATRPCPWKYLTYVLCLINSSGSDELEMPYGPHEGEWKVISLHKENT